MSASSQPQSPGTSGQPDVTALLLAWGAGDRAALDALVPAVYAALRAHAGEATRIVALRDADAATGDPATEVLAVHEALERLALLDADRARLVELRYFAGLTIKETAATLGVSPATANREWAVASAWLRRELEDVRT